MFNQESVVWTGMELMVHKSFHYHWSDYSKVFPCILYIYILILASFKNIVAPTS